MTDKNVNIYQELLHTPEGVRDYYGEENARKQHVSQAVLSRNWLQLAAESDLMILSED